MIRVVLDTNVVVSALLSLHGTPAQILDLVFGEEIQVYYSDRIRIEYRDVLSRPSLKVMPEKAGRFIEILKEVGISIEPTISEIPLPDESDRVFYDTARDSAAILITGNRRHYPTEDSIMTPRSFIELFESIITQ